MPKPKKDEQRRKQLKLREAAKRLEFDHSEAESLYRRASQLYRRGDLPEAARLAKKALLLWPEHVHTLALLAQIHSDAGHHADALYYFRLLRKQDPDPRLIYNCALAQSKLGKHELALAEFREFLAKTASFPKKEWFSCRESAIELVKEVTAKLQADAARTPPPAPQIPEPPVSAPAPAHAGKPPAVAVEFLPAPAPDFDFAQPGILSDYFLRRRFLELKREQNFEDLICLPSLHGVDSYVYQHETVRKVLRHFQGRALLADEVGLGKTIEACLVLKEYWARGMVRRALILVPPSLVQQWKGELTEKFGFEPVLPDGPDFRRDPDQFWKRQPLILASIAMVRLEPHASSLATVPWDMVIVDEAHCLKNRTSANWQLVNSLQKRFILTLTATPVENNLLELYSLITLLKPGLLATEPEFRKTHVAAGRSKTPKNPERLRTLLAEVMIRNTRAAADVWLPPRLAASVIVPPLPGEEELYEMVSAFVAERYRGNGKEGRSDLALEWLQRQAGSSPQALCRSASRALAEQDRLSGRDRQELEAILDRASQIPVGGKGQQLVRVLAAREGKVVVFTEFLPTLEHLARVCEDHGVRYSLFSGDLSRAEKDAAVTRFRDEVDVLLSTGSGGEGRNLQFANCVINFDLPWNPMRLEQRVGRVHRIGQSREVFVFNFCQAGTIEEQLLRVLHDKVNMFELVIGEMDAILGSLPETGDFADIVLQLWISGRRSGAPQKAFDELGEMLLAAKRHYLGTKKLDEELFQRYFEV